MKPLFTEQEQEQIQAAVAAAEARTSGEIVPYIVMHSGRYDAAVWRAASGSAVLALFLVFLFHQFYDGWAFGWMFTEWGAGLLTVLAGTLGALLTAYVPALTRWMAGAATMAADVHARAMRAFVEEEVFNTRDRTGILLFVSLLEHRIEVFGDEGINRKVSPEDWIEVVERIRRGVQQDHLAQGLVEAIAMCGELLERKGVAIKPDDSDELPNAVRVRKE